MRLVLKFLKGLFQLILNLGLGAYLVYVALQILLASGGASNASYQASMFFIGFSYIIVPICLIVALLLWLCEEALIRRITS